MAELWQCKRSWVAIASLMLAACGTELVGESSVASEPSAWAHGSPSHDEALAIPQSPDIARVIVVGDSISVGWGATDGDLGYAPLLYKNDDERYPTFKHRDLLHRFHGEMTWISVAHAGDQASDVVRNQLPRLTQPDDSAYLGGAQVHGHSIVLLTVGGNDLKNRFRPAADDSTLPTLTENLHAVMQFFRDPQRFPDGVSLYFANVYDVSDGEDQFYQCLPGLTLPGMSASLAQARNVYDDMARDYHATLVDAYDLFHGHGFNYANRNNPYYREEDPSLWIFDRDCIHPNNRGHNMLRSAFWRAIDLHPPRR